MIDTPFAVRFAQELMQKYSYELGDITNKTRRSCTSSASR